MGGIHLQAFGFGPMAAASDETTRIGNSLRQMTEDLKENLSRFKLEK